MRFSAASDSGYIYAHKICRLLIYNVKRNVWKTAFFGLPVIGAEFLGISAAQGRVLNFPARLVLQKNYAIAALLLGLVQRFIGTLQ